MNKSVIAALHQQLESLESDYRQKCSALEVEYLRQRSALNETIKIFASNSSGAVEGRTSPAPVSFSSSPPKTVKALVAEYADMSASIPFTKNDVEKYYIQNYPNALVLGERAIAGTLQKLAKSGHLVRVALGENGQPSTYRKA